MALPTSAEYKKLEERACGTNGYLDQLHEMLDSMILFKARKADAEWVDSIVAYYHSLRVKQRLD